ncbi:MAG: response regulator [Balneola sp.]
MKIMIVEDHPDMRRMLKNIISFSTVSELETIECESGEEALESYSIHKPDCVLMDIELKNMNGFKTTEGILKLDVNAKVIFVTSHDTLTFRKKAEQLRARGFISKENLSDINKLLNKVITQL